jgi:prephenate dehydrogenase
MVEDIHEVTVIGVGLIGGSLCSALHKSGIRVKGVSRKKTLIRAEEMGIIDRGFDYSELPRSLEGSQVVFICTPLSDIGLKIPIVFEHAQKNAIVTDVGSTKTVISRIAAAHAKRGFCFIGGHPMAGSELRGVENSNPYLFYDAVYVLTPLETTPKRATKKLSRLVSMFGATVMILPAELHDRIAACVSHMPQILAVSLINHLADKDDDLFRNLAAGGFRDMTRIASSSYSVWRDIIRSNKSEIKSALGEFRQSLDQVMKNLENDEYLDRAFKRAKMERETIPRYSKGFLKPLVDVRVSVQDRPGELARITNIIYYKDVNIRDIEIVNVREGEGGVLRLGFAQKKEASEAAEALQGIGYEVTVVD